MKKEKSRVLGKNKQDRVKRKKRRKKTPHKLNERLNSKLKKCNIYGRKETTFHKI